MAHTVGGLLLPEPEPDFDGVLDPALAALGQALPPILNAWLADAFSVFSNGADLIASVNYCDPLAVYDGTGVIQMDAIELPGLFLFSRTVGSTQITDAHQEIEREVLIGWVPGSRMDQDNTKIDPLFGPFAAAIGAIVKLDRHPSWVSDSDATISGDDDPKTVAAKEAAQLCGSSIQDACGFSRWFQPPKDAVTRFHFTLASAPPLAPKRYDGFIARITACEMTTFDPVAIGLVPTSLSQTLNTGGSDPLTTGSFVKLPAP